MITVNITKAREISHAARRDARAKEFAPHDAIIAKQIPGADAAAAELARQAIREKYHAIQAKIDAAADVEALRIVFESFAHGS